MQTTCLSNTSNTYKYHTATVPPHIGTAIDTEIEISKTGSACLADEVTSAIPSHYIRTLLMLIPKPFPEELDFGFLGRLICINGVATVKELLEKLAIWAGVSGKSRSEVSCLELLSLASNIELSLFVSQHTSLPLRRAIIAKPTGRPHGCVENTSLLWTSGMRLLRNEAYFCPKCVEEDLDFHGQSFWRRGHQIPGMHLCQQHGRAIAHRVSDLIYKKITGVEGTFSSRIAYINRQGERHRLIVADSDGYGEQVIKESDRPIAEPAWSPDGNSLAYVSFEQGRSMVYSQSLLTQGRLLLAAFPVSNTSPTWLPDGKQLATVLSHEGNSQIYLIRTDSSETRRITESVAADIDPAISPDGRKLVFASDRDGTMQLYGMPINGGNAEKLTTEGKRNSSPKYSPDGKSIVFTSVDDKGDSRLTMLDLSTNKSQVLTSTKSSKPSFSPSGERILFATELNGRGIIATVSKDGRVKQKIFPQQGDIFDPAWSPQ